MCELEYLQKAPPLALQTICLASNLPLMFLDNFAYFLLSCCPLLLSFNLALLCILSAASYSHDFAGLQLRPLDHGLTANHLVYSV